MTTDWCMAESHRTMHCWLQRLTAWWRSSTCVCRWKLRSREVANIFSQRSKCTGFTRVFLYLACVWLAKCPGSEVGIDGSNVASSFSQPRNRDLLVAHRSAFLRQEIDFVVVKTHFGSVPVPWTIAILDVSVIEPLLLKCGRARFLHYWLSIVASTLFCSSVETTTDQRHIVPFVGVKLDDLAIDPVGHHQEVKNRYTMFQALPSFSTALE